MKEIKAIIQPFVVSKVVEALQRIQDLPGITVSDVWGFGQGRALNAPDKLSEAAMGCAKKSKLEIVVPDELAEGVVQAIREHAHTGNPGDGKIFVHTVDDVIRIRTGERGEGAI